MANLPENHTLIRYTADVVAVTDDGRVLLIQRGWDPYAGHWALPGGHVDDGETSRAAAVRELEEETGVRVTEDELRLIGVWAQPGRDPRGRYVTVAYLAVVPAGTRATAGDDARDARWWPLTGLPERLAFDHADILAAARRSPAPGQDTADEHAKHAAPHATDEEGNTP
ncbi:NUDIX hydrolase [Streptomyces sp. SR27]|uniref:NUDIX hydrolase n=1 Tax=Streptomyces sp. SR27 TaxID=3076630 RepID=UPI00295B2CAA|nr:NUDIX hydrolase [Streptomyces sp. SR27]MDV9188205.1 NUDIX hydrolase [Streptomyces sp. SR27]